MACKKCHVKTVFFLMVGIFLAGLSGLQYLGEQAMLTSLSFMGESITFDISTTALRLCFVTVLALGGMAWWYSRHKKVIVSRYQMILISFSLSFGFIAFISGQFMIRYIALDIVGLLAAMIVLNRFQNSNTFRRFVFIFQMLRLGDLSLLASILLLNHYSGTLDISRMITAATELPLAIRTWVLAGFVFAILVKAAIWPFGLWVRRAWQPEGDISNWISGFLMPVLGYYLLYRIQPILTSEILFQNLVLVLAATLFILSFVFILLGRVKFDPFTHLNSFMSCFLLAAFVYSTGQTIVYWMLGLILYRLVLFMADQTTASAYQYAGLLLTLVLNLAFIWVNADHYPVLFTAGWIFFTLVMMVFGWVIARGGYFRDRSLASGFGSMIKPSPNPSVVSTSAVWLNQIMEIGLFTKGFYWLSDFFMIMAVFFQKTIEQSLEGFWSWIGQKLISISEDTLSTVEMDAAEKTDEMFDSALNSLAIYEQNILKKTLRWDLALIPIVLAAILILLFVL